MLCVVRLALCVHKNITLALQSVALSVLKGGSQNLKGGGGGSATVCQFGKNPNMAPAGCVQIYPVPSPLPYLTPFLTVLGPPLVCH